MIVVIPRTDPQCNPGEEPDWEWLPRICPACGQASIIGHGRRDKQAHEEKRGWIRIRRGFCTGCRRTCTVLPAWSLPHTQYGWQTRQQSWDAYSGGRPLEEAAPTLLDADRGPETSTLRRWFRRRIDAARSWLGLTRQVWELLGLRVPTILAWDWRAALCILIRETKPDENTRNGP